MSDMREVTIGVVPVLNGWRAVIYIDGVAVKMGPASPDRDVALLYAGAAGDIARSIADKHRAVGQQGQPK